MRIFYNAGKLTDMKTVRLSELQVGDQFRFRFSIPSDAVYQVQHKLISQTGGVGVVPVTPNLEDTAGVYHPRTIVIPV